MMEQTLNTELLATDAEQIRVQMREFIVVMQAANERIKKDQEEIERLKAKTRATLAELAELKLI